MAANPIFAREILDGLNSSPKRLSSKWFYDERGDKLFQQIMAMPEYYLTDCEREIFQTHAPDWSELLGNEAFDLVELGAGDGSKTRYLIDYLWQSNKEFVYRPIDISQHAIEILGQLVATHWPLLPFEPVQDDYLAALGRIAKSKSGRRQLVLFPGANVGNFTPEEAVEFLRHLGSHMKSGDLLLTGFDLKKDPAKVLAAYNDETGHTAAFNLNLLARINRELGADFDLQNWQHWETYDPLSGAAKSFIVAQGGQSVRIADLDATIEFAPFEAIAVEISQKYSRREIAELAGAAGFEFVRNYEDSNGYFADSLWRRA